MSISLINQDKDILGGTPVFAGTRVPVDTLFAYLSAGDTLDEFLDDFPSVTHEQAVELLRLSETALMEQIDARPVAQRIPNLHPGGWMRDDFTDPLPDQFWLGDDK
jgi:uncharacterized protein (DUF433 family)